jgi:hypothetical protein
LPVGVRVRVKMRVTVRAGVAMRVRGGVMMSANEVARADEGEGKRQIEC